MVNANSKLQVNNSLLKIIITFSLAVFLSSCGSPTTVITRGDTSVIDKERIKNFHIYLLSISHLPRLELGMRLRLKKEICVKK